MSRQLSYAPSSTHPRNFYHSHSSMTSPDSGHFVGSSRDMGPPPAFQSDFPVPQPIEVEVNRSRTLPSPAAPSATWENFPAPGLGGYPEYGPGRQLPLDGQIRTSAPDPLQQWYTGNDGPWIPKGISPMPRERSQSRVRAGNRIPTHYGSQFRQPNPSEAGSLHYGVPPSDSGYGTRLSDGSASVFSADVNERDPDCHSLVGHVVDYQPFPAFHDVVMQQRDSRPSEPWLQPVPSSTLPRAVILLCPTCGKTVKTPSELKKHDLRHTKPFVCDYSGCSWTVGFSTTNDLERHKNSKHPTGLAQSAPAKRYRCHVPGCKSKDKSWPRLDNFRSHLKRLHADSTPTEEDFDELVRRAEFWDQPDPTVVEEGPHPGTSESSDLSQAKGQAAQPSRTKDRSTEPEWKPLPVYPEVLEAVREISAPKTSALGEGSDAPPPDHNAPALTMPPLETVQPKDVLLTVVAPLAETRKKPSSLDTTLLAPVGKTELASEDTIVEPPRPTVTSSKAGIQTKEATLKDESASNVSITEAMIVALIGAGAQESVNGRSLHLGSTHASLPHDQSSSDGSGTTSPYPSESSTTESTGQANSTTDPAVQEDIKSLQERKAREVLKTLHDLGYIVQKNPSHAKLQNPGSAASNKSENVVTCRTCKRFMGRPCELKKHMKRHSRPYGCTFLTCNKTFGSKNDWKRHENSQHYHLETWRCDAEKIDGAACAKVCYRKQSFQDHLRKDHEISDPEVLKTKAEACHIGRNCQSRFWCGFCPKLVDLTKKGLDAWTERFDHIDDHFMGRHGLTKQGIQAWVPVNGDKPKGESSLDLCPKKGGSDEGLSSSSASSPEAQGAAGDSPARATKADESRKRRRTSSDDEGRTAKTPKTTRRVDTIVYCCQCTQPSNPRLDARCNFCESSHQFCDACTVEARQADQDKSPAV